MDLIWQFIQQRMVPVAAVAGIVIGLLLGLAVGWGLWPVEWTNATPAELRSDFQHTYVLAVAEDYAESQDLAAAREKLGAEFWEEGQLAQTLQQVEQAQDGQLALNVRKLARDLEATAAGFQEEEAVDLSASLRPVTLVCGIGLLVVALVGGGLYLYARLIETREEPVEARGTPRRKTTREAARAEQVSWEGQPPNAQFVTTYVHGDTRYDPSFSIELETGEFMGECGVGISEVIGTGDSDRVTALEAWLFDKNDIRTVTKVLMSPYAFNDEALRTKLAPKGEPILVEEGRDVVLETKMLRLRAHVVEVEYGNGDMPANSFFDRLTVELAAWVKPEGEGAEPRVPVSAPDSRT
ncbi:MAG: hypothetical protein PVJ55_01815 [Anaerolineae bacterium]